MTKTEKVNNYQSDQKLFTFMIAIFFKVGEILFLPL